MSDTSTPKSRDQRDPELAAELNEQRRQSYNAETMRTRPAPAHPGGERPALDERLRSRMMVESVRNNVRVALENDRRSMEMNPAVVLAWLDFFDLATPTPPSGDGEGT